MDEDDYDHARLRAELAAAVAGQMRHRRLTTHAAAVDARIPVPTFTRVLRGTADPHGLRLVTFVRAAEWAGITLRLVAVRGPHR